jgi:hypothetical protein
MALSVTTRKSLFGINALSAWIGLGMSTFIEIFGLVETKYTGESSPTSQFGHQGDYASGLAGAPERLIDLFSYFTIWSQIVVGVVMTLLYLNPARDGKLFRVFRLDSILMITVTGVVYNLLLGPNYPPQGLNQISSPIQHTITPLITVLVFVIAGPRGWITLKNILAALVVPIVYVFYTLTRGAIIGKYPYDFFDVITEGYAYVLIFVMGILFASIIVAGFYWGIDKVLSRKVNSN